MNLIKMNRGLDFLRDKYGAAKGEITMKGGHCFVGATPLINLRWHKQTIQAMLGCYESIQSGKIAKVCA